MLIFAVLQTFLLSYIEGVDFFSTLPEPLYCSLMNAIFLCCFLLRVVLEKVVQLRNYCLSCRRRVLVKGGQSGDAINSDGWRCGARIAGYNVPSSAWFSFNATYVSIYLHFSLPFTITASREVFASYCVIFSNM